MPLRVEMNLQTLTSKNHRVIRIVEFYNNLCEKESRSSHDDSQLPSLRLKIARIRELIAILSLYEDRIKYLTVDSNRIIPCNDNDRERLKFTDCKIQLVVQIRRQTFWNCSSGSASFLTGRSSQVVNPLLDNIGNVQSSHATGQTLLPTVNIEFRLGGQYPQRHSSDCLYVQISKVVHFSAVKQAALKELLRYQIEYESGPEVLYGIIWSVTYFLHILDSYNDDDALLHISNSAQLISELVCVHPHHLTSPTLLNSFLDAQQQATLSSKRKRKLAYPQLDQFYPDSSLLDARSQTFIVRPSDLVPSVIDKKSADELFHKMPSFQFENKHCDRLCELSLRLEAEVTHCFYIKKLCFVRHRQEYSGFEVSSGLTYRFLRVAFELKPMINESPDMPEILEQACKSAFGNDVLEKLEKTLKLQLSRDCQFVEPVYFQFQFKKTQAEFLLVNETLPIEHDQYCSLEALSKTINFHETGVLLDLRYRILERILIGFGHLHKAQFAHGSFESKKLFVSSNGDLKIYDAFLDAAIMQLIPLTIEVDDSSIQKVIRLNTQKLSKNDCFNIGSLVLALWSDCTFEPISSFMPEAFFKGVSQRTEERLSKFPSNNVAHFAKECFKIYFKQSELELQNLLNHVFILEWQKKSILEEQKKTEMANASKMDALRAGVKVDTEDGEVKIPSYYRRRDEEFFPVMSLGKGAFGSVFSVRNNLDGTEYALKCVHLRDTDPSKNNILREANHLARLVHSNVVRYYASWLEHDSGNWEYLEPADDGYELNLENYDSEYEDEDEEQADERGIFDDIPESDDGDSLVEFVGDSGDNLPTDTTEDSSPGYKPFVKRRIKTDISGKEKNGPKLMLCIQMELCDRWTLRDKIMENSLFEDSVTRYRILKEMLAGLDYIHSMDIIHRDLKPTNIFFFNGRVKIGDFGLSRSSKQDPNCNANNDGEAFRKISATAFGSIRRLKKMSINYCSSANTLHIGTAQYMAPEVMLDAHYNQKIDLFSLGVIFFEMFYPMSTMSERARLLTAIRPTKTTSSIFPDDVDKYFRPVEILNLKKLLSINPSDRPTAFELLSSSIFTHKETIQDSKQSEELNYQESCGIPLSHLEFIMNRLLENPTSPQFMFVIRRLMNRRMPLLSSISYDYDIDRSLQPDEDLRKTISFNQIELHFERLTSAFGALKLSNISMLLPDYQFREDAFKICDENGVLCDLPYERRMLLSRYLAFNAPNLDFMICSNFSPIYRKALHGAFHPRQVWTASFDQIWPQSWSENWILPFCEQLTLCTRILGPILHRGQLIYHLTSLDLLKNICNHLNVAEQVRLSFIHFLRENDERVLGQSVDEMKLSFQMLFESAGISERVHKFIFSLLKISTSNPGDLLKNIQSKCQEFDVQEFPELITKLTPLVYQLERIVNLYRISSAVYMNEQVETRVNFRFGLALLAKTAVEYESLAVSVVYEDLQCERRTLLAIGGRFDGAIQAQENMIQQVMPTDLQEALNSERENSKSTQNSGQTVIHDHGDTGHSTNDRKQPILLPKTGVKRIALGLTFSIEKLSKLEWKTNHLHRFEMICQKNNNYLVDVLIVTTTPTIHTCKIIQELRTYNLRVQVLTELLSISDDEFFREVFNDSTNGNVFLRSFFEKNSTNISNSEIKPGFEKVQNVIRYQLNGKIHFIFFIDTFKESRFNTNDLNTHYSVIENSISDLSLYRFYENDLNACKFIRGALSASVNNAADRKIQRSVHKLRKLFRDFKTPEEDNLLVEDVSIGFETGYDAKKTYSSTDFFYEKSEIGLEKMESSLSQEKIIIVETKSRSRKTSSQNLRKDEFASKKEKARESRKLVKRTLSESQLRRSRSGSTVSTELAPDLIDVGFVTGSKVDRQQITSQVNEFIGSRLHYLLEEDQKLKVLVTNLVPFSVLRTFADCVTACFTDEDSVSPPSSQDGDTSLGRLERAFFSCLAELKSRNRTVSDVLEKIGQKLWAWIEDHYHHLQEGTCQKVSDQTCLVILMHVGDKPFRYRIVQLDFY